MSLNPMNWSTRTKVEVIAVPTLFILGLGTAKFALPAKVVTQTVDHVVTKVEFKDKIVEKTVTVHDKEDTKNKVTYIDRVITKDGETHETVKIVYQDKIVEHTNTVHDKAEESSGSGTTDSTHTVTKIVTAQPPLLLFAGIGVKPSLKPLGVGPAVVLGASYRIAGPVGIGAWITVEQPGFTQLAPEPMAGLLVSVSF